MKNLKNGSISPKYKMMSLIKVLRWNQILKIIYQLKVKPRSLLFHQRLNLLGSILLGSTLTRSNEFWGTTEIQNLISISQTSSQLLYLESLILNFYPIVRYK